MTRRVVMLALGIGAACAAPAPAPDSRSADQAAIEAVLDGWYTAMIAKDSAGTVAPLTEDFLLLEDTLPLSRTELAVRLLQGVGQWTSKRHDFQTRVAGDVAWSTFRNDETSLGPDGTSCAARFLETAVFVRRGGAWLIDRYHAAAVERWHCGPPPSANP
ncbi:MAG TPA: nuclear transport factor 2 family protein [Gemmatimonadales bacterium]